MSYYDYQPPNKFGYKDQLPEGDAEKIIKGSEFDAEFQKISAESEALDQELQEYDGRLDAEIADRIAGDENLQNQIDTLVGGGEINIDIEDVEGLAEFIDQNYVSKTTAEAQQIVSKFTFTTEKLGDQHGPNRFVVDPATYTAQFLAGSDMIGSDSWNNWDFEIQGGLKLTSMGFPPSSMQYNTVGMTKGDDDYIRWTNVSDVFGETDPRWVVSPKLEVEGGLSVGGTTEITGDITLSGGNIIIDGGSIVDPDGNPQTGGSGASVHIGEAPPVSPEEGQQWLETPAGGDAKMWIWDGAVWLEQPSNGSGGDVDLSAYSTTEEADLKYQPKGDYVTDLTGYAKYSDDPATFAGTVEGTVLKSNAPNWSCELNGDKLVFGRDSINKITANAGGTSHLQFEVNGSTNLTLRPDQKASFTGEVDAPSFKGDGSQLTNLTESDPTVPTHVKGITQTNINNWNTAHGWGNHASAGYSKFSGSYNDLTDLPTAGGGGMEYDIDQPFTITTPEFYGDQPHSLVINHGKTTAATNSTVAVAISGKSGAGIQFNDLDNNGNVLNQKSIGLKTDTNNGKTDPYFAIGGRKLGESNGGNVDLGGSFYMSNYYWLRNINITGAYTGTNVVFRDSAGVTAQDLIDVFVALKDAVSNVTESDPIAAMSSMRSAITTTSDSLIQKFEAIHGAVADELENRRIAYMEDPNQ